MSTKTQWIFWILIFVCFILFMKGVSTILLPFVIGGLTAYFLDPSADKLERLGLSRWMATLLITSGFFILITLTGIVLFPVLYHQLSDLAASLPETIMSFEQRIRLTASEFLRELNPQQAGAARNAMGNISGTVAGIAGGVTATVLRSGIAMVNVLSLLFITPVVTYYLLRDWDVMVEKLYALLPRPYAATIREQLQEMDKALSGFIRGQTIVCVLLAIYYAVGLSVVGLNYAVVIGLFTGLMTFIPYVGLLIGMTLAIAVALFQYDSFMPLLPVLLVFISGQIVEGNFVTPRLVGEKVGLHPVWLIFGMLSGAALFGFTGVLLAVPVTAVIGVLVRFAVKHYLVSPFYTGT